MMHKSIKELHDAYRSGATTVVAVVSEYLKRIESTKELNVYLTVNEKVLELSKEMDQKLEADRSIVDRLALFGVPIAHKDIFLTKDLRTTAASKVLENYIPAYSGTVVKKLEEAGALLLGKVNCDAWAHGSSGENSDFGPTKNPLDQSLVPGGSSSGSAAAVAADIALITTATDTGGSIRLPANFTGTVGLKPTYGRVSRFGVISMASSLDSIGHFSKNVEDSARVLSVTSGMDVYDANTSDSKPFDWNEAITAGDLTGWKIGVPKEYVEPLKDEEVKTAFERSVDKLRSLGAEVVEVSLPYTEYAAAVYYILQPSEVSSNLGRYDGVRFGQDRENFGPEAVRRILIGTYTLSAGYYDAYYKKALKVRTLIKKDFDRVFETVDLLVAPVSPTLPFKIGEKIDDPVSMYLSDVLTIPMNLAGIPALAIPDGKTEDGLPTGLQLIGPRYSEEKIYQAAYRLEQVL
jgi:aspartyl-tRNA(Asn)/glutamyl-tRNA(Gln) amidotransferase subunit A